MKTIHLRLRKGKNTIRLQNTSLNTTKNNLLRLAQCKILWTVKNIRATNNTFLVDTKQVEIPEGYYTFSTLQEFLKSHKITITKRVDNHVELTSEKNLDLKQFGPFLGFEKDKKITKSTDYVSLFQAEMTNGLKTIDIYCPTLVDAYKNFSNWNNQYVPSSLLLDLAIDTTQSLNGTVSIYDVHATAVPLVDFRGQDIELDVVSGGSFYDYEIRLTLYIE